MFSLYYNHEYANVVFNMYITENYHLRLDFSICPFCNTCLGFEFLVTCLTKNGSDYAMNNYSATTYNSWLI